LSDIKNKSDNLITVYICIDGSYAKASSLVARERAAQEAVSSNGNTTDQMSTGDQYIFNQTNNSPKAISAADSYRGTKSLISMSKDVKKGAPTK
jgi:hypothetical protein